MNHLNEARLLYFQEAPITEVLNEIKKEDEWFSYENQEWIMNNVFSIFISNASSFVDCS